jgi:SNF2 family DNA or RNA helicase
MSLVSDVLFGYQVEAAERIFEKKKVLLADQPGLGKTLEVLGGLELAGLFSRSSRILILTPLINAQTTWIDSIERFINPRYATALIDLSSGTAKKKNERAQLVTNLPTFYVANHNAIDKVKGGFRVDLTGILWDAVIVDESHMVLPITGTKETNFWQGLESLKIGSETIRVAVSGTPDRGKLENRYGTWRFLYPEIVRFNRYKWLEKHFWMVEQRVSRSRTIKVPAGIRDERQWLLYDKDWMIRRTKNEVLTELPAKRYVDVELELSEKQRLNYFVAQMDYEKALRDRSEAEPGGSEAMIFALRSRQLAVCDWVQEDNKALPVVGGESAKLEWLVEWLTERGFIEQDAMLDNTAKVVIVSQFSKVLEWLRAELALINVHAEILDGSTKASRRIEIQREFQDGDLRIVLLSGSMGVGINLDAADDLIMLDSPYDPDRIEQIEDRVHRASNMHSVTIWNLLAVNTIDQAIAEKVSSRYRITRKLLDGTRGIDFARKVIATIYKENK